MTEIISGLADKLRMSVARTPSHKQVNWDEILVGDGFEVELQDYLAARVMAHRKSTDGRVFKTKKKGDMIFIVRTA